ncbi:MAG: CBS domain-containing protein [Gaiellaceae bacterium]
MASMIVRQIMSPNVITVTPETSLKELSSLLAKRRISGAPVVESGVVLGVVSETDVVLKEEAPLGEPASFFRRRGHRRNREALLEATCVRDVMSTPAVTIEPWMSVSAAALLMVDRDVNRLPVVDREKPVEKLVGIVTRADVVKAFARSDSDIKRELREVTLPSLGLSPNDIDVSVQDGVVSLEGNVEDERDARTLLHASRGVIGVVRVDSRLAVPTPAT